MSEGVIRKLKRRLCRKFEDFMLSDGRNIHKAANKTHTGLSPIIRMNKGTNREAGSLLACNLIKSIVGLKTLEVTQPRPAGDRGSRIFSTK
jgi:hypothetical protein